MQSAAVVQLILQALPEHARLLAHSRGAGVILVPPEQTPRSTMLVPEHVDAPQAAVGYWQEPSVRPAHEPAQVASDPHDCAQQYPSFVQIAPVKQPPVVAVQSWPFLLLQAPAPSHVPAQCPEGSSIAVALTHTWLELHIWHGPAQSVELAQPPVVELPPVPPNPGR